jgi:lysophospholipase L1-like esterase
MMNRMKFTPFSLLVSLSLAVCCGANAGRSIAQEKAAPASYQVPATDDGLPGAGPINRADWFVRLWENRRTAWSKRVADDQKALVLLGDSITQGWEENDLAGSFPGIKVANRGISGDMTRGMLIRLQEDVLALNPAGVVLMLGTNDIGRNADPETVAGNFKLILAALKKHDPKMPIVLCLIFPSAAKTNRPAEKIKPVNDLYLAAVKGDPQVTVVDTWTLFADEKGEAKPAEFPDLLHPNKEGYRKWAAALRPVLATLDFLEKDDDKFTPEPGFVSLFNGRDLTGWGFRAPRTLEPQETFDSKPTSSDGRYVAKHGRLIVTTPPEGRRVQQMWTTREFPKNFVLKLEFRATPNADSGVFIRRPQLQCRDYPLAGPYKELKNYRPQDWNEMVVSVKDNVAHCTCNGEVLEAKLDVPATGPIGLEGDRGQMEYRRIRIQELP